MSEKDDEILLKYVPDLKKPKNILFLIITEILLLILVFFIYWFFSSTIWYGAILIQLIVSSMLSIFYILLANNAEKIREKYLDKYKDIASQKFWYHYQAYLLPIIAVAVAFTTAVSTFNTGAKNKGASTSVGFTLMESLGTWVSNISTLASLMEISLRSA